VIRRANLGDLVAVMNTQLVPLVRGPRALLEDREGEGLLEDEVGVRVRVWCVSQLSPYEIPGPRTRTKAQVISSRSMLKPLLPVPCFQLIDFFSSNLELYRG
jgi:hypothetical protein